TIGGRPRRGEDGGVAAAGAGMAILTGESLIWVCPGEVNLVPGICYAFVWTAVVSSGRADFRLCGKTFANHRVVKSPILPLSPGVTFAMAPATNWHGQCSSFLDRRSTAMIKLTWLPRARAYSVSREGGRVIGLIRYRGL